MERIIEAIKKYIVSGFTGKITLHLHKGIVKKVTEEKSIEF